MKRIYLDQAATSSPKAPGVGAAMAAYVDGGAFNIGRGGYEEAYTVSEAVLETRELLLALFGAPEGAQLCFTGGATQALNQFLRGFLRPGDHILVSSMEHNAVMRPLHDLQQAGVSFTAVPCDGAGRLDPAELRRAVRPETKAVLLTHASNLNGTVLPLREAGSVCRELGLVFAVDAAQSAGILPLDMTDCGIDFLAFPGHKALRGPQGIGGFAVRKALAGRLRPLILGGTGSRSDSEEQPEFLPDRFESGTLPLPAILGLRQALRSLSGETEPEAFAAEARNTAAKRYEKELRLTRRFLDGLAELPSLRVPGVSARPGERAAVVSIDFTGTDNALAAFRLEQEYGILTRVGLHCAPRAHKTLGTWPQGTVRFSFGAENTEEEVDRALQAVDDIVHS